MSYLQSIIIYIPAIVIGFLLVHLLWPERGLWVLLFKLSLGVGAGLGLTSLLYFIILLVIPIGFPFSTLQIIILLILLFLTIRRERTIPLTPRPSPFATRSTPSTSRVTHYSLLITLLLSLLITIASFINFSIRRDQGAFDAWMIYNRAARFIVRDPANWQATLSPDLSWGFHADYPLLVSTNVAWAWTSLGAENIRVPLVQSGLFLFACIGLLFTALAQVKGIRQSSLAAIILMSISGFVRSGSGQTADVPLAFFMLASIAIMSLRGTFFPEAILSQQETASPKARSDMLLVLSGFMAGLAGWTKNEGLLFIAVSVVIMFLFFARTKSLRSFIYFGLGLVFPALVILYFKSITPAGDLFSGSPADILARIADPTRYLLILKSLGSELLSFGGWPVPLILFIILLFFVFGSKLDTETRQLFRALSAIAALQLLGYLVIYLITPHDLAWQLGTALDRNV
ncbi:MAG: hypothetical protein MUO77_19340, partial [Anaerolineales bacterium]|nr:hypothetical protein [Anaerolineales bacterium]